MKKEVLKLHGGDLQGGHDPWREEIFLILPIDKTLLLHGLRIRKAVLYVKEIL